MKLRRSKSIATAEPARRRAQSDDPIVRATEADLRERYAFRRNRTLTGSSSPHIASSNELQAELQSPRSHAHHLAHLRRRMIRYFTGVAAATFLLYVIVSQLVATTVPTLTRSTAPLLEADANAYQAAVESYYGTRPAERFRFLTNMDQLTAHVQSQRPEVSSLRLEPGTKVGESSVVIIPRSPIARWTIDGSTLYVDGSGTVFSRNYFDEPALEISDESGLDAASTRLVTSNRFLGFIGRVVASSREQGLTVTRVSIPPLTTRQIALTLEGQSTQYKLSVDRSAGEQTEDIARVNRYLSQNQLTPGYVDVRVAGKAFYK